MTISRSRRLLIWAAASFALVSTTVSVAGAQGADKNPNRANGDAVEPDDSPAPEPTPPPPPPSSLQGLAEPAPMPIDEALEAALVEADVLTAWHEANASDPGLALVEIASGYAGLRLDEFVDLLGQVVENRNHTTLTMSTVALTEADRDVTVQEVERLENRLDFLYDQTATVAASLHDYRENHAAVIDAAQDAAVGLYMGDERGTVETIGDVGAYNDRASRDVLVDATIEELFDQRDRLEEQITAAEATLVGLAAARDETEGAKSRSEARLAYLERRITELRRLLAELLANQFELNAALPDALIDAQRIRLSGAIAGSDVSIVAVDAYVNAAATIGDRYPNCGVRWELLAGIGKIESGHGTHAGSVPGHDGVTSKRILGPLLDGTLEGTQIILDSDGGRFDGNAEFDAALGPMQFLPGTWRSYGLDGNDDGFADPHNLYDAAMAAAGYLCATTDVTTDAQIQASVLTYNHSGHYLANVTAAARNYAQTLALPEASDQAREAADRRAWSEALAIASTSAPANDPVS